MTQITHDQVGTNEDLAREVLIIARDIAPCISSLEADSEDGKNALAVLRRVYKDTLARGSTLIKAQRIGPASVDYSTVSSAFEGNPTRALRAICQARRKPAHSLGSFPTDRPISRLWPEGH